MHDLAEVSKMKDAISKEFDNLKKVEKKIYADKCDMVDILEHTLSNKDLELERFRKELEKAYDEVKVKDDKIENSFQYPCNICEFKCSKDNNLKKHMEENHEYKCDVCDLTVTTKEKFDIHICRYHLKNPEHKNLYLKNWIVWQACSSVYCKEKRTEVSILHSEACLDFKGSCLELPGWYCRGDEPLQDEHLRLNNCIQNGEVNWSNIKVG